ncbi:MAG: glycosyltransferase [Paracoccus sp. (in: a-proteobacteria)]|uniref:glycosyltransferase n=1 Tax=Paracoccus sp. TaxID=267 RepID=UPI0039E3AD8C
MTEVGQISVIVPIKGHPVLLDDALAAVHREMESGAIRRLVVVDDGCEHDETRASIASWQALLGSRMLALHFTNGGLSAARNRGIRAALGADPDIAGLLLLDADNTLVPGAGAAVMRALARDPDCDWFYPDFDFFGQKGHYIADHDPSLLFHAHLNLCEAGSLIRRRVFEAGIRFDEAMKKGYEDWDFWLSAARSGFRGKPLAEPLLLYRKRPASMLSHSHDLDEELRRFLENKHRWLFSVPALLALEAARFPRYAIIEGDSAILCTDPDHAEPVPLAELERRFFAHFADPYANHAPAMLIVLREGVSARLKQARLMHNFLWIAERRLARQGAERDLDLFFLNASESGHAVHDGLGNPALPPDGVVLGAEELRRIVLRQDLDWIRDVERAPNPHPVTSWGMDLDGLAPLPPHADGATEILRSFLLMMHRSRYLPALEQSWRWREPGGAANRASAVEIPRKAASGGVVLPLLKEKGRKDIGLVLPIFDFGGVEKVAASLARELSAAGHRLHLFIASDRPIHGDGWALRAFHSVNWLPDAATLDWSGPEYMGTAEPRWGEGMERADLVGLLSSMDAVINAHSAALHKVADRLKRQGVLMIDHEHLVERSLYGRNYGPPKLALAYEHAYDLFLTCSQALASWMNAHGIPQGKLMPVVNAPGYPMTPGRVAEVLAARGRADLDAPLRVLFMGRLDPQKGVARLAAIYGGLARHAPEMQLTIAGQSVVDDPAETSFPQQTRMLGAMRGPEALTALLAATDILVLPSHYEGLPLSVLEAQRLGVVVLATEVGAMREAIRDGVNGYVIAEQGCEEGFVERILALDEDREILRRVSAAASRGSRDWGQAAAPLLAWLDGKWGGRRSAAISGCFISP